MITRSIFFWGFLICTTVVCISCRTARIDTTTPTTEMIFPIPTAIVSEEQSARVPVLERRLTNLTPPKALADVIIVSASPEPASVQMPAYIEAEITGINITDVDRLVGRHEDDGRLKIISIEPIFSDAKGNLQTPWFDGSHDYISVWYPNAFYLTDTSNGDFAIVSNAEADGSGTTIRGVFKSNQVSEVLEEGNEAVLFVDSVKGQSGKVVLVESGEEIVPGEGDSFQLTDILLEDGGMLRSAPGKTVRFDADGKLLFEKRQLSHGHYFVGLMASAEGETISAAFANFLVRNDEIKPDMRAYFEPRAGYQFLYPSSWQEAQIEPSRVFTSNVSDTIKLTITTHPEMVGRPIEDLQIKVLESFGEVQILYEDKVSIGSLGALRTVYAYESNDGPHTGIFLTLIMEGLAYVIDVDGLTELENEVVSTMERISSSFVSRPSQIGTAPGKWIVATLKGLNFSIPANYRAVKLENGWERFDSNTNSNYIALRVETGSGSIEERLEHWQEVAAEGVQQFVFSESYDLEIGSNSWRRLDFNHHDSEAGTIFGSLLFGEYGDQLVILWAEAAEDNYPTLERDILSILAASVVESG